MMINPFSFLSRLNWEWTSSKMCSIARLNYTWKNLQKIEQSSNLTHLCHVHPKCNFILATYELGQMHVASCQKVRTVRFLKYFLDKFLKASNKGDGLAINLLFSNTVCRCCCIKKYKRDEFSSNTCYISYVFFLYCLDNDVYWSGINAMLFLEKSRRCNAVQMCLK